MFLFSVVLAVLFLVQLRTETVLIKETINGVRRPIITKADNPEGYWIAQGLILAVSAFGLGAGWFQRRKEWNEY